mgnify:CR=1 FL=1
MSVGDLFANLAAILPVSFLMGWACLLLLVDLWMPRHQKGMTALLAALGLVIALGFTLAQGRQYQTAFNGMVVIDGFAIFLNVLFLSSGLIGIALAYDYLKRMGIERGEYYALLIFSIGGMMLMSVAADLIIVLLSLEWLSIPLYVLAGFARPQLDSEESAIKYFLMGAFASSFVLFGVALVFGASGTTALQGIVESAAGGVANLPLMVVGAALILIGIGYKVSAVPFHMWTPDVYHGAPSAVTAFMAVGAKAGGFAALLRVFVIAFPALSTDLTPVLWGIAVLTMVLGNVVAIAQSNIKRMLAYSSIAHAGYILMAAVPFGQAEVYRDAVASALFYLVAYGLANFGAWAVVIALEQAKGEARELRAGLELKDYAGLGKRNPLLAAAMTIFMLSFTGVPPTLGFVGKFYLFRTTLEGGYVGLALIGVLTSLISAYYYLRLVVIMYMQEGEPVVQREPWLYLTAAASAAAVVILSLFSAPLFGWASQAVFYLF